MTLIIRDPIDKVLVIVKNESVIMYTKSGLRLNLCRTQFHDETYSWNITSNRGNEEELTIYYEEEYQKTLKTVNNEKRK